MSDEHNADYVRLKRDAVQDVADTLMDWFPILTGETCHRVAALAVAACERAGLLNDGGGADG